MAKSAASAFSAEAATTAAAAATKTTASGRFTEATATATAAESAATGGLTEAAATISAAETAATTASKAAASRWRPMETGKSAVFCGRPMETSKSIRGTSGIMGRAAVEGGFFLRSGRPIWGRDITGGPVCAGLHRCFSAGPVCVETAAGTCPLPSGLFLRRGLMLAAYLRLRCTLLRVLTIFLPIVGLPPSAITGLVATLTGSATNAASHSSADTAGDSSANTASHSAS